MQRVFQIILVVLTISFSAFLISRSCSDHGGENDPYRRGGEAKNVSPPDARKPAELTASASPAPTLEEQARQPEGRAEDRVKESATPERRMESRTVAATRPNADATPEPTATATPQTARSAGGDISGGASIAIRTPTASAPQARVVGEIRVAYERVQGTWVLTDERGTKLELTVLDNTGSVRANVLAEGRSFTVEQRVRVIAGDNTVHVYGVQDREVSASRRDDVMPSNKPIILTFTFNADGTPNVVLLRNGSVETPLKVVSHTK